MSEAPDEGLRDDALATGSEAGSETGGDQAGGTTGSGEQAVVDPDADPGNMPVFPSPPTGGPVDGTEVPSAADDPEDEVDPDADPEMMGSTHAPGADG